MTEARDGTGERGRSVGAAALVGVGLMAAVDEIVFHQLLGWHHFYDRSTPDVALLSDGLLHAAELVVLVAGAFLLADLVRRRALVPVAAWAGGLLGAGGFQLVDGLVNHKVLRLHQVRYDVDLLPYDLAWNGFAVALLVAGLVLLLRSRRGAAGGDPAGVDGGTGDGTRARGDAHAAAGRAAAGRDAGGRRAAGAHAAEEPAPGTGRTHAAERPARPAVRARVDEPPSTPPRGRRRAPGPATGALPLVPPRTPEAAEAPEALGSPADAPRRRRDDRPSGRRAADP
ncbi:DUF2243 domain-containing protein [Cellulomonas sp. 179-A 9B4 NHS]|uniref:DUF2243 domain-containing protein n=1 Tax=Cellulomonas sp. 179-A 9B4 NHS TaxID=3142379 RepID=UPI00399FB2CF